MLTKLLHVCLTGIRPAVNTPRHPAGDPPEVAATGVELDRNARIRHHLQRFLGRLAIVVIAPATYLAIKLAGYRIRDLRRFRKMVRHRLAAHDGPWLICANHLTMIDSALIAYALAPLSDYLRHYRRLPWNVPEQANFQRNIFSTIYCYLTKCIPINRRGERTRVRRSIDRCVYLLQQKELLLVFPEGTRSRSGRVDFQNITYGVGRFLQRVPDCQVLCIYLRGDRQQSYSTFPTRGERFSVRFQVTRPHSGDRGIRAQRSYARQIIATLAEMEQRHFDSHR